MDGSLLANSRKASNRNQPNQRADEPVHPYPEVSDGTNRQMDPPVSPQPSTAVVVPRLCSSSSLDLPMDPTNLQPEGSPLRLSKPENHQPPKGSPMKNLEPHQYRLLNERAELRDRLEKLDAFIHSGAFPCVPPAERERLQRQATYMGDYLGVLNERVEAIEA